MELAMSDGIEVVIAVTAIAMMVMIATVVVFTPVALMTQGSHVVIKATGVKATVVARDERTIPYTWICRIDNGPDTKPRYTEVHFSQDEVEVVPEPMKEKTP